MSETTHVIAGRCTALFDGTREEEQYGDMIVLAKPDDTVLVHDGHGYQPVAWLTRAESVIVADNTVRARDGEQVLEVTIHDAHAHTEYPASQAGIPVGECPDCGGVLTRARGTVRCQDCQSAYSIPSRATVLDEYCSCGLPKIRVERGEVFEVCLDRSCDSIDDRVREAFDREWECPDCDGELRVLRRGGLLLGCDRYPDCDTSFSFPSGLHVGTCACGLPHFETANGTHCLDSGCDATQTLPNEKPASQ